MGLLPTALHRLRVLSVRYTYRAFNTQSTPLPVSSNKIISHTERFSVHPRLLRSYLMTVCSRSSLLQALFACGTGARRCNMNLNKQRSSAGNARCAPFPTPRDCCARLVGLFPVAFTVPITSPVVPIEKYFAHIHSCSKHEQ